MKYQDEQGQYLRQTYGDKESAIFRVARVVGYITVFLSIALLITAVVALILAIGWFVFEWIVPNALTPDFKLIQIQHPQKIQ
jgi:hypothetical protein